MIPGLTAKEMRHLWVVPTPAPARLARVEPGVLQKFTFRFEHAVGLARTVVVTAASAAAAEALAWSALGGARAFWVIASVVAAIEAGETAL